MSVQDRLPTYLADQREHFDAQVTEHWTDYSQPAALALWRYEIGLLLELVRPATILDLGCGASTHDAEMARRPFVRSIDAVDYSRLSVERAAEHFAHPKVRYSVADFLSPGAVAGQYDLVVSFQVIEHLEAPEGFLRLCRGLCRPGGCVAVFTVNRMRPYNRRRLLRGKEAVLDDPMHRREFDRAELALLGAHAGLRLRRAVGYTVAPPWRWRWLAFRLGRWVPRWAERLCAVYESDGAAAPAARAVRPFYEEVTWERVVHYFQQIDRVLALAPRRVLEIGPGDYTVTEFLRGRGVEVRTLDLSAERQPDYVGDVSRPLVVEGTFDVVLASEILEHLPFALLDAALENIDRVLAPGGHVVVSVPYATIRLFPPDASYGRFVSCTGRVATGIPWVWVQHAVTAVRGVYRLLVKRYTWRGSFRLYGAIPRLPEDSRGLHHWEVGRLPVTRRRVVRAFGRRFDVVRRETDVRMNCVFFILRKRGAPPCR